MATLADNFRAKAKQYIDASSVLLASDEYKTDVTKQISIVVAQVNANTFQSLADIVDWHDRGNRVGGMIDRAGLLLKKNDAIRKAAASGNWDEFDKLVNGGEPKPDA